MSLRSTCSRNLSGYRFDFVRTAVMVIHTESHSWTRRCSDPIIGIPFLDPIRLVRIGEDDGELTTFCCCCRKSIPAELTYRIALRRKYSVAGLNYAMISVITRP